MMKHTQGGLGAFRLGVISGNRSEVLQVDTKWPFSGDCLVLRPSQTSSTLTFGALMQIRSNILKCSHLLLKYIHIYICCRKEGFLDAICEFVLNFNFAVPLSYFGANAFPLRSVLDILLIVKAQGLGDF